MERRRILIPVPPAGVDSDEEEGSVAAHTSKGSSGQSYYAPSQFASRTSHSSNSSQRHGDPYSSGSRYEMNGGTNNHPEMNDWAKTMRDRVRDQHVLYVD
jgi:hypothetical protein